MTPRLPSSFAFVGVSVLLFAVGACGGAPKVKAPREEAPPRPGTSASEVEGSAEVAPGPYEPVTLRYPRSETPWLGVELRATPAPDPGVLILRVLSGSPAEKATLAAGDVILTLGDGVVMKPEDVAAWVKRQPPGVSEPIGILRKGQTRLLRAHLEGTPDHEDQLRLHLVHRPAPEVAGVTTYHGEVSSLRELRGRVVILEFWGAFCPVCRYMSPVVEQWHQTYQPQGAVVFGISADPEAIGEDAAQRLRKSYTLARDTDGRVIRSYMASQIPMVVIIDKKGIVRDALVGYSKERIEETRELIEELLAETPG